MALAMLVRTSHRRRTDGRMRPHLPAPPRPRTARYRIEAEMKEAYHKDGDTEFKLACRDGQADAVRRLLRESREAERSQRKGGGGGGAAAAGSGQGDGGSSATGGKLDSVILTEKQKIDGLCIACAYVRPACLEQLLPDLDSGE